jgi:hypothetical protein
LKESQSGQSNMQHHMAIADPGGGLYAFRTRPEQPETGHDQAPLLARA